MGSIVETFKSCSGVLWLEILGLGERFESCFFKSSTSPFFGLCLELIGLGVGSEGLSF